jgi:hypothetical protein
MIRVSRAFPLTLALVAACTAAPDSAPPEDTAAAEAIAPAGQELAMAPTADEPACWLARGTTEEAAQRPSPRDSASTSLAGGTVKVCYGAPSARGRTIIGGQDPFDQPWRMGADEATALHVTVPVRIGDVSLEPGSYSIFGIPTADRWTVVINRNPQRWGIPISPEVRSADIGEITVTPEVLADPVETLRYRFEPAGEGRVDLLMEFETTRVRIPIQAATA